MFTQEFPMAAKTRSLTVRQIHAVISCEAAAALTAGEIAVDRVFPYALATRVCARHPALFAGLSSRWSDGPTLGEWIAGHGARRVLHEIRPSPGRLLIS